MTSIEFSPLRFRWRWRYTSNEIRLLVLEECSLVVLAALQNKQPYETWVRDILHRRVQKLWKTWALPNSTIVPLLRRHASVLSGSAALSIAFPGWWQPGDLDFYCPHNEFTPFVHGLLGAGYVQRRPTIEMPYWRFSSGIDRVAYLSHPTKTTTINVIQSSTESALTPIYFFHSTVVMNIVTPDGVAAFYPTLTDNNQGVLNNLGIGARTRNNTGDGSGEV